MDRTIRSKFAGRETHIMALVACGMFSSLASAETVTYYVVDHLGSPVAAMQSDGTLLWRESYNPYGGKRVNPSSADDDTGYTGHQFNAVTDLTYMQARYYDPVVGRFMGVDPVIFKVEYAMTFNRYAYANDNPFIFMDPDGRETENFGVTGHFSVTLAIGPYGGEFQVGAALVLGASGDFYGFVTIAPVAADSPNYSVPTSLAAAVEGQVGLTTLNAQDAREGSFMATNINVPGGGGETVIDVETGQTKQITGGLAAGFTVAVTDPATAAYGLRDAVMDVAELIDDVLAE